MTGAPAPMSRAEAAALLRVPVDAPPTDVQRAFLRAARYTHPDTIPNGAAAERQAAADRFDALMRARGVLMVPDAGDGRVVPPVGAGAGDGWVMRAGESDGPRYRPVRGRGLGGSLVVLALLAFLLVALVSLDEGFRGGSFDPPAGTPAASTNP